MPRRLPQSLRTYASVLLSGLFAAVLVAPVSAQAPAVPAPDVVPASRHNTSQPLRDMPIVPGIYRQGPVVVPNKLHVFDDRLPAPPRPGFVDPALDLGRNAARVGEGTTLLSIQGIDGPFAPPDPSGDIGPTHYVQMVNVSTAIFNRDGSVAVGAFPNNQFWQGLGGPCETKNDGDPIVVYDEYADRWFVSQFALNPYAFCAAVSVTGDPTGAYHQYEFPWAEFLDYPKVGVGPEGYYVSTNTFSAGGGGFLYAEAVALERDQMLQGLPAQSVRFQVPGGVSGLNPADTDGTAAADGTPGLFTGINFYASSNAGRERIQLFALAPDWATPSNSTLTTLPALTTAPFARRTARIPQPGTSTQLDNLADRLMYRTQYRNQGTHQTMMVSHTVDLGNRAGIRWYELRDTGSGWTIYQQGTYGPDDGVSRWMGSVAMNDNGDIGLAYSAASTGLFPSVRFTGQTAAMSGSGQMDVAETVIHDGAGAQTSGNRWGDYSQLTIDPTDGVTFWHTQEYSDGGSQFNSKTRIGRFSVTGLDPPILAVAPSAVSVSLDTDETTTRDVTVSNSAAAGASTLNVSATVEDLTQPGGTAPEILAARAARDARRAAPAAPQPEQAKGDASADGTGSASRRAGGGPDAAGNVWTDSNEPGGPTFAWVDISGTGTAVALSDDNASSAIALPFAFPFYGADQNQVYIGSNGYLTFGTAGNTATASRNNQSFPSASDPDALIAMFWDDLHPGVAGTVHYQDMGDGRFIVQFTDVRRWDDRNTAGTGNTFQAVLFDDGTILYQYLDMNAPVLTSASVGIENADGTDGLTVIANAAYITDGLAVRFTQPAIWARVAPASRTVAPGASGAFTLSLDAAGLPDGTYTGDLVLTSNDPDAPTETVPLTLIVGGNTATMVLATEGVHLFAPAEAGLTVADLAALNLVRGVPGYAAGRSNLFTDYADGAWVVATGADETLELGRAVRWFLRDGDEDFGSGSVSRPLPTVLTTSSPNTEDVTLTLAEGARPLNMLGNPFGVPLDVSSVTTWPGGTKVGNAFLWDSGARGFVFDPAGEAAPWQAFFVKTRPGRTGTITIPASAAVGSAAWASAGTNRATATDEAFGYLRFDLDGTALDGAPLSDGALALVVGDDAVSDAKLRPLSNAYVAAGFSGSDALGAIAALRADGGSVELPIAITTVGAERGLTLRWDAPTDLPDGWRLTLVDRTGGTERDLSRAGAIAFESASAPVRAASSETGGIATAEAETRFVLRVDTGDGLLAKTGQEAFDLALDAPFPNPTRELARVPFTLAEAGAVRLSVYDALGREIAVLVDGELPAGPHTATLNAQRLAAGTYVVRLMAGGEVMTTRATVVR